MLRIGSLAIVTVLLSAAGASARVAVEPIVYAPSTLPAAQVGTPYDVTITATQGGQYLDLGINASTGIGVPGLTYGKGAPVPTYGGASLRLYGTPTKGGVFTIVTEITGSDGSAVDAHQFVLKVAGGKEKLTKEQADRFVADIQSAIADERQARLDLLAGTARSGGRAKDLVSQAIFSLHQPEALLPDYTWSGPSPVPNLAKAAHADSGVREALREQLAGDNFGKPLPKALIKELVADLGTALVQKKHALSYMQQIAGRLTP